MATKMRKIVARGDINGVDILVEFETEIEITEKVNFGGLVAHVATQLAYAGMERPKSTNGRWVKEVKAKTGATGEHPDDYYPWPGHKCEVCGSELGLKRVASFKAGPHAGEPGWRSWHINTGSCKATIWLTDKEYTVDKP